MDKGDLSALGLGCMGMTGFYGKADREQCIQTIHSAFEQGITFFDTADNYGFGENEILLGAAIAPFRNKVSIATKVGVVLKRETPNIFSLNGSPEYIREQCTASLKRLGISTIDLYYLHHVDPNTPIEKSIHAMAELVAEGKVRHIGLGDMPAEQIRRAHKIHPITAFQAEYSLFSREAENQIIPLCKELGITFIACAPLCRGLLSGKISSSHRLASNDSRRYLPRFASENLAHNLTIVSTLEKVAQSKSCSLAQLALAWISTQSLLHRTQDGFVNLDIAKQVKLEGGSPHDPNESNHSQIGKADEKDQCCKIAASPNSQNQTESGIIVSLFGTTQPAHLEENIRSTKILLTRTEIHTINEIVLKGGVRGSRHPEMVKQLYKND